MSILIKDLDPLKIVSKFGNRIREGKEEFHPGIDIRVVDEKYIQYPIVAPEKIEITAVKLDPKWGHYIKASLEKNKLGIVELRFWHIKPACKVGDIIEEGDIIGAPESGYVPLHLHFETRIEYRGTTPINPVGYLEYRNQKYI